MALAASHHLPNPPPAAPRRCPIPCPAPPYAFTTSPPPLPHPLPSTSLRLHHLTPAAAPSPAQQLPTPSPPHPRRCPIPCPAPPYAFTTSSPPLPHPLPSSSRSPSGPSGAHHLVPGSPLGCAGYWLAHTLNPRHRWMRSSGVKPTGRDKSQMAGTPQPSAANDWIRAALRRRARGQAALERQQSRGVLRCCAVHAARMRTGASSRSSLPCPSAWGRTVALNARTQQGHRAAVRGG